MPDAKELLKKHNAFVTCGRHGYNAAAENLPPLFDTGLSRCVDCVWAWADWLEYRLNKFGGHTADCSWYKQRSGIKCDCGFDDV